MDVLHHGLKAERHPGDATGVPLPQEAPAVRDEVLADAALVRQCLAGDGEAWGRLYHTCHPRLCEAVGYMLRRLNWQAELTDEIAARVWYSLVRDDGRLLAKFDSARDCRLGVFLVGLARNEILQYTRSERRRTRRERIGGKQRLARPSLPVQELERVVREFAVTLTAKESQFLYSFLLASDDAGDGDEVEFSDANIWQHRHRLRKKFESFLADE